MAALLAAVAVLILAVLVLVLALLARARRQTAPLGDDLVVRQLRPRGNARRYPPGDDDE